MKEAPVFVRAYDLYSWLLDRFNDLEVDNNESSPAAIGQSVLEQARWLLEALVLALSRFDTEHRLVKADEHAALLRLHLRLASEKKLLSDSQLAHATRELRDIGRQIGGWRKTFEPLE